MQEQVRAKKGFRFACLLLKEEFSPASCGSVD